MGKHQFPLKKCAFLELLKEHQGDELINVISSMYVGSFFGRNIGEELFFWKEYRVL